MNARFWISIGAAVGLFAINFAIAGKERIVRSGMPVYLALAPVDPRSLMQGDYMALRFAIADQIAAEIANHGGDRREGKFYTVGVDVDQQGVATLSATATQRLRYRWRNGQPWIGTNAFFFEEGSAGKFEGAQFGEFRLDPETGEAVLIRLVDVPNSER